eukprot:jgi/Botrbrau1/11475/Bobra.0360s0003.2
MAGASCLRVFRSGRHNSLGQAAIANVCSGAASRGPAEQASFKSNLERLCMSSLFSTDSDKPPQLSEEEEALPGASAPPEPAEEGGMQDSEASTSGRLGPVGSFLNSFVIEPPPVKFPIPQRKKGRKPNRAQRGSYRNRAFAEALKTVSDDIPPGVPLYDMQTTFPYFYEPRNPAQELLEWKEKEVPGFLENLIWSPAAGEEAPPYPGARQILRWQTNLVLMTGDYNHPLNKKVRCWVYLRDLQEQTGLSDDAIRHVALIAGPRSACAGTIRKPGS